MGIDTDALLKRGGYTFKVENCIASLIASLIFRIKVFDDFLRRPINKQWLLNSD